MNYKTFQQWSSEGYKILKGSKATWIEGVAVFSNKQVVKKPKVPLPPYWNGNMDYQESFDRDGWVEAFPGADGWGLD